MARLKRRILHAELDLLDRQIVDRDGRMVGKVDDLELTTVATAGAADLLAVSGILTGPGALGPRIGGWVGDVMVAAWARLAGRDPRDPKRIDRDLVVEIGTTVTLSVRRADLTVDMFEHWVRERVIDALPGAGPVPDDADDLPSPAQEHPEPRHRLLRLGRLQGMRVVRPDGSQERQRVVDAVLELLDPADPTSPYVVRTLVVGRVRGLTFGYFRDPDQGPWLLKVLVRRLHRHTGEIGWGDVDHVDWEERVVRLRRTPAARP